MAKIKDIFAKEIFDSRGVPTIETKVLLDDGSEAVSSVPSGVSKGKFEAVELRDNDPFRYRGQGVLKAVRNVNEVIKPIVVNLEAGYQEEIDKILINTDGTENKSKLGANAILSSSQAILKAQAISLKLPTFKYIHQLFLKYFSKDFSFFLPQICFNLIEGGKHGAGNNLDIQEFLLISSPKLSLEESLSAVQKIYHTLSKNLGVFGQHLGLGDEEGYAPNLKNNSQAIEILLQAAAESGFRMKEDFFLGLDIAADKEELLPFYQSLDEKFDVFYLEDPFSDEDWQSWQKITSLLKETLIVADDLICTNPARIKKAIELSACNSVIIKPNQIGTVTEALQAVSLAKKAGFKTIASHRSGETADNFIADFAVAVGADLVKFGVPLRVERVAKYNRLLEVGKII